MVFLMDCLRHIEERLDRLILKGHSFMALVDEFREKLAECDAETNRIAARLTELVDQLQAGGLSESEETEAFAGLTALADKLKGVGQV